MNIFCSVATHQKCYGDHSMLQSPAAPEYPGNESKKISITEIMPTELCSLYIEVTR